MSGTFALDAVHRVCTRLDAIQDHYYAQPSHSSGSGTSELAIHSSNQQEAQNVQQTVSQLDAILAKDVLHDKALPSVKQLQDALQTIKTFEFQSSALLGTRGGIASSQRHTNEDAALAEVMAVARLTYAVYGVLLDKLMEQAEQVNDQAWYWTEVEDNVVQTALYLVQTLPERAVHLVYSIGRRITERTQAAQTSAISQARDEFRAAINRDTITQGVQMVRDSPALAIGAMFPMAVRFEDQKTEGEIATVSKIGSTRPVLLSGARALTPLGLTRHEAKTKRAKLLSERDAMAERVGTVAQALCAAERGPSNLDLQQLHKELWARVIEMQEVLAANGEITPAAESSTQNLGTSLENLLRVSLQKQEMRMAQLLSSAPNGNGVPTRLARLWPALLLGPMTAIIALRIVTRSWDTIIAQAHDARETVRGFFINWVYEPCVKLLGTIRTGDQEGVIMTRESLNSDLQSLERMVADFSAEKYGLTGPALEEVANRVREGDLSNVLRIYETELKSPLRSAISGSLIRSLLIQVQKVKVDIAVAMRGVDQLLKSQQLLFGAIGIAPAMGILYVTGGFLRSRARIALGSQGRAANQGTRFRAWEAMRRVDRLLADPDLAVATSLPPKTQGLLLLDLSLLRRLAPQLVAQIAGAASGGRRGTKAKRLRQDFLRDVRDLESGTMQGQMQKGSRDEQSQSKSSDAAFPGLGWHARRATVERMWKSWGGILSLKEA